MGAKRQVQKKPTDASGSAAVGTGSSQENHAGKEGEGRHDDDHQTDGKGERQELHASTSAAVPVSAQFGSVQAAVANATTSATVAATTEQWEQSMIMKLLRNPQLAPYSHMASEAASRYAHVGLGQGKGFGTWGAGAGAAAGLVDITTLAQGGDPVSKGDVCIFKWGSFDPTAALRTHTERTAGVTLPLPDACVAAAGVGGVSLASSAVDPTCAYGLQRRPTSKPRRSQNEHNK